MRKILHSNITTVALIAVCLWLAHGAWSVTLQRRTAERTAKDLAGKIAQMEREHALLEGMAEYFQSQEYLDKQARLKLNYKLADEKAVFVYPDAGGDRTASASAPQDSSPLARFWKWLYHGFR